MGLCDMGGVLVRPRGEAVIPYDQKGITKHVPLSGQHGDTEYHERHRGLLQPHEEPPRYTPRPDLAAWDRLYQVVRLPVKRKMSFF